MMPCGGVLHLLTFFIALNLFYAKHFLVEMEDKKNSSGLFTQKKVNPKLGSLPKKDKQNYKSLDKPAQQTIQKKKHELYGNDYKAVRYYLKDIPLHCWYI